MLLLSLITTIPACPVFAEEAQLKTTRQFISYLESRGVKYQYVGVDGNYEMMTVSYSSDNYDRIKCSFYFCNDLEQVGFRVWSIVTPTAGKSFILSTINSLNRDYKYAKFVYNAAEGTVQVEMDFYVDADHCDRCVYDGMQALVTILDIDTVAERLHSLE